MSVAESPTSGMSVLPFMTGCKTDILLDGDPATIRNSGQILRIVAEAARAQQKRSSSAIVVVEA